MPRPLATTETALNQNNLLPLAQQYPGPFWAYDAGVILQQIEKLRDFDVIRFAQKACSNIHILRLMRSAGVTADSVSLGEIDRALVAGYPPAGDDILFTAAPLDTSVLQRVAGLKLRGTAGSAD